jgi:hypothetical protein
MPIDFENDSFFKLIKQKPRETSVGPCDLPILYNDASFVGVIYRVDPKKVAELLGASSPFEPLLVFGKALCSVSAFEYRESTVGAYNEIALVIQVKRKGTTPSLFRLVRDIRQQEEQAFWVVNLPVTTQEAMAAGFEIWGFPKYVTRIDTDFASDHTHVTLENEFTLKMGNPGGLRIKGQPFANFTINEGHLIRTIVEVDHKVQFGAARKVKLEILGNGPSANSMKTLGLAELSPTLAFRTDGWRSILPEGKDLGAVAEATGQD